MEMKSLLEEFEKDQLERFKICREIEEVLKLAEEMNLDMNKEKAALLLKILNNETLEFGEDELREVSGGQAYGFVGTVSFLKNKNGQ